MFRSIILFILFFNTYDHVIAQVYKGSDGEIRFFSNAPLENIEATSRKVTAALKSTTNEVAVLIPIKSFVFKNGLMQEHFNDSYLESDRYPDATFTGHLNNMGVDALASELKTTVRGSLNIHGVNQERDIEVMLKPAPDGTLIVSGKFLVKLTDHKIKIPRIVFKNIAESVEVSFVLTLKKSDK